MKIKLLFLILIVKFSGLGFAKESSDECNLQQLSKQLSVKQSFNHFTQSKTIKVLSKPLISNGNLLLLKQKGVVWQTVSPIKGTTVITSSSFSQLDQNDKFSSFNNSLNSEASQTLSNIFLGLLSGDLDKLQQHFTITSRCQTNSWRLTFEVSDKKVGEFLQNIILTGKENNIEKIEIFEANQDYSEIQLQPSSDLDQIKKLEL